MRLMRLPWVAALPVAAFTLVFAGSFAYFRATDADPKANAAGSKARPVTASGDERLVLALHAVGSQEPAEAYLASVAVDGSDIREITQPPEGAIAADGSPSVSPDGKTIAFSRAIPGEPPHIYLVGIDGSGLRRFTQGNLAEIQPVWSPDGTRIAFSRVDRDGEHFDLFVAGADGSGLTQLTHTPLADEDSCTWSPNGLQLAFTRFQNHDEDVLAINVDGTEQHALIRGRHDDASPSWSPDGPRIAITRDGRIAVFSFEHFKVGFLTEAAARKDTGPSWSPDGSRIIFTRDPGAIYVMNADGSKLANVPLDKPATAAVWEPTS
jgi:Tol biopolymer transport system component